MIVFTSITLNYLPKARILAKSIKKFHSDWSFHLLINDKAKTSHEELLRKDLDPTLFDKIVYVSDLGLEDLPIWLFKHNVVELCTAVKGIYVHKLVNESLEKIIYIDPDIVVFNDLEKLDKWLDSHSILLTPHLLDYSSEKQFIQDNEIAGTLRHGIFNLGFIAINPEKEEGRKFSAWWKDRLYHYCYADYESGLFTDQKWCDLIPSFFTDYLVIRDPGFNVASWNLDCRDVSFSIEGQLRINKKFPLRFYHFTGYDSGAGMGVIDQLTTTGDHPVVRELWGWYESQLFENHHEKWKKVKCYYDFFSNGKAITNEMRKVYRMSSELQKIFQNPYDAGHNGNGFFGWWHKEYKKGSFPRENNIQWEENTAILTNEYEGLQAQSYVQLIKNEVSVEVEDYIQLSKESLSDTDLQINPIAFYLPQFHPIPENDKWWGKGFTEWTNVTKAIPQFPGHYQPHLPGELGFYDLRVKEIQYRQIELAKQYGIKGFAFYHYWFDGKRLLEYPLEQFLQDKDKDFPFCLIWANENWTRRWDGLESDVLINQNHNSESDKKYIKDISPFLNDERYIRINNRPVIIIYRVDLFPNPNSTAEIWKEYCVKNRIGEPYLIAAQTFGFEDPRPAGFDAAVQFPPHNKLHDPMFRIDDSIELSNPNCDLKIFSYQKVVEYKETDHGSLPFRLFKTAFPSWDNEARKPGKATMFTGSTPDLYKRWLTSNIDWTIKNNPLNERLTFINAWNEWAEGAHLEPDRRYGYAYLQATYDVLKKYKK
ncbi:MAG TPA: glycoside hydrolase family 99-like domain-containing protein [Paludibacter sp.]|nr:glycoside hydrolase family 99-like domain-containing protein [Paludibacter sp.]HPM08908.1 glycoside hydrolase family 99-like domain-containing protein [Paludibacter sp.]